MISYLRSLYAILISFSLLQSCNHVVYQWNGNASQGQSEAAGRPNNEPPTIEEPDDCCVCLQPLEATEVIVVGACNHRFHQPCIVNTMIAQYNIKKTSHARTSDTVYNWTQAQSALTCPCCRGAITNALLLDILKNGLLLLTAVEAGDATAVEALLKKVDPNTVKVGELNNTLLHVVKDPHIAQLLINAKADLNAKNTIDHRPLHVAAHENNVALMQTLLEAGAEVDSQIDWLWTPLYFAVQSGHIAAMEILIAYGADLNAQANLGFSMKNGGITPLHLAALFGQVEALNLLINKGANLEVQAIKEYEGSSLAITPLAMAVLTSNEHFRELFPDVKKYFNEDACKKCIADLKAAGANTEQTNALGYSLEELADKTDFPFKASDIL